MFSLLLSSALAMTAHGAAVSGLEIAQRLGERFGRNRAAEAVRECPEIGRSLRGNGTPVTCACPAVDPDNLGTSVWGDSVYTDDSNICLAAIHDGKVTPSGGRITVWAAPGQARYNSATRNGIASWPYTDFEASIRFTPLNRPQSAQSTSPAYQGPGSRRAVPYATSPSTFAGNCPEIGNSLRGTSAPLTCVCPAVAQELLGTSVWGNLVYTDDSNICLAAIHDGRVSLSGGKITVWASPGRAVYRSANRNGINSIAYRDFEGSIQFTPPTYRRR